MARYLLLTAATPQRRQLAAGAKRMMDRDVIAASRCPARCHDNRAAAAAVNME